MEGDGMPQQVCAQCLQQINRFYSFKRQCEKSDITLRQYIAPMAPPLTQMACDNGTGQHHEHEEHHHHHQHTHHDMSHMNQNQSYSTDMASSFISEMFNFNASDNSYNAYNSFNPTPNSKYFIHLFKH